MRTTVAGQVGTAVAMPLARPGDCRLSRGQGIMDRQRFSGARAVDFPVQGGTRHLPPAHFPGLSAVPIAAAVLPPEQALAASVPALTPAGQAALEAARVLAQQATAPATLKADWTHYADWCAAHGFIAVPAAFRSLSNSSGQ
jgi:hypothetical protein